MLTKHDDADSGGKMPPDYRFHSVTPEGRVYLKENQYLGIRTYMIFRPDGLITIRKTQRIDRLIDRNVAAQNDFQGFKRDMALVASVPIIVDQQFKKRAGYDHRTGNFDRDVYNRQLDDRDNYKLKTVPKRIGHHRAFV